MKRFIISCCFILSIGLWANAQISLPPAGANQKSVITQYIGSLVHVTITYNSPDVTSPTGEDRRGAIWGQLVPYGLTDLGFGLRNPSPWRAGANENTTIEFSHDVEFQGQAIQAGKYGFHVVAEESGNWTIILSNNSGAWGSFFYDEKEDALRVEVSPEESEYHEWLTFEFTDRQADQCTAALVWETKALPFTITVPGMNDIYLSQIRSELQSNAGFTDRAWSQAATFCLNNEVNLEEGLVWAETALSNPFWGQKTFTNYSTKAQIQSKLGQSAEAGATMEMAINDPGTKVFEIHNYGRWLLTNKQSAEALRIFKFNNERYGDTWPVHVGLARGYSAQGEYELALKHAKKAHEQAPDELNKSSMAKAIETLKQGKDIN